VSNIATESRGGPIDGTAPLLYVSGVSKQFGGTRALDNVNLQVARPEIVALLGENGAGCVSHASDAIAEAATPLTPGRGDFQAMTGALGTATPAPLRRFDTGDIGIRRRDFARQGGTGEFII
jgi:ABC-type molybdenum transport system ATPase subunit/photorepair protein PhrA